MERGVGGREGERKREMEKHAIVIVHCLSPCRWDM
jgi:hypothetical protein